MLKKTALYFSVLVLLPVSLRAADADYRKQETLPYKDIYEQNVHSEIVNQLDLSRQSRRLFHKPLRSADVNIFDEVPDSAFYTKRHARMVLSKDEMAKAYAETVGPDLSRNLTVIGGEINGLQSTYRVKDARGDTYLLKFDSAENAELSTAAEVIASRVYYALGYNVPQYTVVSIPAGKLKVGEATKIKDDTGFVKTLTQERLDEYLLFSPQSEDGSFRVSATKIISGESKGFFSFTGRRKNDPDDLVNHRDRREIRALSVFSAWVNNTDVSESNTYDALVTENGKTFLKHYLIDFNSALGSSHRGVKPPMFGHEYAADFGETTKAFLTLGFWEKPWQKRWREAGEKASDLPGVGYFDNRHFPEAHYKVQLPYEAFKRLTRADGFWAAKQIMAFSDDDIRAMVSAGKISSKESVDDIVKTLIERRNLIGQYWFSKANSLDDFKVESGKLAFKDLAVNAGFATSRSYIVSALNEKNKVVKTWTVNEPQIQVDSNQILEIRTSEKDPSVRVSVNADGVASVHHQD